MPRLLVGSEGGKEGEGGEDGKEAGDDWGGEEGVELADWRTRDHALPLGGAGGMGE
jgi:hypothetical protein